jgi:chaperonin GroEL
MVTKDGVTVAKAVELTDRLEDVGARMVREVASKTNDVAGDGTTTATVLADAIFTEGLRAVVAGVRPIAMKLGMEKAVTEIVRLLKCHSTPISGRDGMAQVATVAANNDRQIGEFIAEAIDRVGKDGVVTIEEGKTLETTVEFVEGMQFDKGFLSPYFITDQSQSECVLEDAYVLVHEKKLASAKSLLPLLEAVAKTRKPLLIVAEAIEGDALSTLVVNRLRGTFACCAVKAPAYGERRKEMLEDIATLTGATAIMESLGIELANVDIKQLGHARKIVVDKDSTTIIEGGGSEEAIVARVAQIDRQMDDSTSEYDREKLGERKAKLSGGVARINIGGATETEVKQKKALFDDALYATRAALAEGILPGGGVALLRASSALYAERSEPGDTALDDELTHDEAVGYDVVVRACRGPLSWIAANAGQRGSVVCEKVLDEKTNFHFGYNAATDVYEDLTKAGVIDPTKVVRSALENAASVSALLLTSDAVIAERPRNSRRRKSRCD